MSERKLLLLAVLWQAIGIYFLASGNYVVGACFCLGAGRFLGRLIGQHERRVTR